MPLSEWPDQWPQEGARGISRKEGVSCEVLKVNREQGTVRYRLTHADPKSDPVVSPIGAFLGRFSPVQLAYGR